MFESRRWGSRRGRNCPPSAETPTITRPTRPPPVEGPDLLPFLSVMLAASKLRRMTFSMACRGVVALRSDRCALSSGQCHHGRHAHQPIGTDAAARRGGGVVPGSCRESRLSHVRSVGSATPSPPREMLESNSGPAAKVNGVGVVSRSLSAGMPRVEFGRVELIMGPMFAGKTTELLKRVRQQEEAGRSVIVVKSSVDDRYSKSAIVSHDGERRECYSVPRLSQLKESLGSDLFNATQVIAIDEAQFFGDLREFCDGVADVHGKIIIIAGLSGDYRRQSFGDINSMMSVADHVTQLTAICRFCKVPSPAPFTRRLVDDSRIELVGGAETYVPVCRRHYFESLS